MSDDLEHAIHVAANRIEILMTLCERTFMEIEGLEETTGIAVSRLVSLGELDFQVHQVHEAARDLQRLAAA